MKFLAEIQIILLPEIQEPQGAIISRQLKHLDLEGIGQIRIGKFLTMELEADSEVEAHQNVEKACQRLLANPIMESFSFHLKELTQAALPEEEITEAPEALPEDIQTEEE